MAEHALDNFDALTLLAQLAAAGVAQLVWRVSGAPVASTRPARSQSVAHW
jgi:hypothetical protein